MLKLSSFKCVSAFTRQNVAERILDRIQISGVSSSINWHLNQRLQNIQLVYPESVNFVYCICSEWFLFYSIYMAKIQSKQRWSRYQSFLNLKRLKERERKWKIREDLIRWLILKVFNVYLQKIIIIIWKILMQTSWSRQISINYNQNTTEWINIVIWLIKRKFEFFEIKCNYCVI